VELYRQIEDVNTNDLSKLRWTIGFDYSLKKLGKVELFYRIDNELNQSFNKDTYILGVGYKFSF
jgi:opacity protein-like surface antigen